MKRDHEEQSRSKIEYYLTRLQDRGSLSFMDHPLSPIGRGIEIKKGFPLVTRPGASIKPNVYPLLDRERVGFLSSEGIEEMLRKAREDGEIKRHINEDGTTVEALSGDVELTLTVKVLQRDGEPVTIDEILSSAMLNDADNEEEREFLTNTLFTTKPKKREQKPDKVTTSELLMPNDRLTKALMTRGDRHIKPQSYVSGEKITLPTGRGMSAIVSVDTRLDITDLENNYQLNDTDRVWLENLYSLARDGHEKITGSDLLKMSGYENPYDQSMQKTMQSAFDSAYKATHTDMLIDSTEENREYERKRGVTLLSAITPTPIVKGTLTALNFEDGVNDFTITLEPPIEGNPLSACTLAMYAEGKGHLLTASKRELEFVTLKRLTHDHRRMWRYVVRRLKGKGENKTIVFETMFKDLNLEDASKDKKYRMLRKLRQMLEERSGQARDKSGKPYQEPVLSYTWTRKSRKDYSVTVEPVE